MKTTIITLSHSDSDTKKERIKNAEKIIDTLPSSDLYMLPEMWNTGFFSFESYAKNAEPITGETVSMLSRLASKKKSYIFTGSIIEKRNGNLYNTCLLLDRNGEICGKYSKTHLFGKEREYITSGDELCVCDTEFGKIGLSICYDLRFCEMYRAMIDMGAEIFLNCSAWPKSRLEHWSLLNRVRAFENQAMWFSSCMGGTNENTEYAGVSYAVSPKGDVLAEVTDIKTVTADLNEIYSYRADFPVLKDRGGK